MSRRRTNKRGSGCGQPLILFVVMIGVLWFASSGMATQANAGMAVHPLLFVGVLVAGVVFVGGILTKRISFGGVLIAIVVGVLLILLGTTRYMPVVDNPCPGDEVIIVVGGECRGMDTDANRAWLERQVR